jgi:predicted Rossmann-fold nucleotide-binding protein
VLRWTFVVSGPGTGTMADVIDGVMTEQFRRLGDRLDGL